MTRPAAPSPGSARRRDGDDVHRRQIGAAARSAAGIAASSSWARSVAIQPGTTESTRTPSGRSARSSSGSARPSRPRTRASGRESPRRRRGTRVHPGAPAVHRGERELGLDIAPRRLRSSVAPHCSGVASGKCGGMWPPPPALLTRIPSVPCQARAASTSARTSPGSVRWRARSAPLRRTPRSAVRSRRLHRGRRRPRRPRRPRARAGCDRTADPHPARATIATSPRISTRCGAGRGTCPNHRRPGRCLPAAPWPSP